MRKDSSQHYFGLNALRFIILAPSLARCACKTLSPGSCFAEDADDVVPLLQVPKILQRKNVSGWTTAAPSPSDKPIGFSMRSLAHLYFEMMITTMMPSEPEGSMSLREVPNLHRGVADLLKNGSNAPGASAVKPRDRAHVTRQIISAVVIIMVLMTVTVSIQVLVVEFVLSGHCVSPHNLLGAASRSCMAIFALLRFALRTPARFVMAPLRACWWRCRRPAQSKPIFETLPAIVLQEMICFSELTDVCTLCNVSQTWRALSENHCSCEFLVAEVERLQLKQAWQSWQSLQDTPAEPQPNSNKETISVPEAKVHKTNIARELKRFLFLHMQEVAAREHARELEDHFGALVDIVRFFILLVSWFWFSAEVMDLACVDGTGGTLSFVKAISSPLIFLFVLECDRDHFMCQCLAGFVALALLLDLIHRRYEPLRASF